jgi:hypothetical protein
MITPESQLHNCPSSYNNVHPYIEDPTRQTSKKPGFTVLPPSLNDILLLNKPFTMQNIRLFLLKKKSKVPHARFSWTEKATNDAEILRAYAEQYPGSNLAAVLPGHIIVIDEDPKNSPHGQRLHEMFLKQHGALPETWVAYSGKKNGGRHSYLLLPEGVSVPYNQKHFKLMDGAVELLGQGHYVVAPPSLHPDTGLAYTWDRDHNPFTCDIAPAPEWLIRHIQEAAQASHGDSPRQDKTQKGENFVRHGMRDKGTRSHPSDPSPHPLRDRATRPQQESLLLQRVTAGEGTPQDIHFLTQIHAQAIVNALCRMWDRKPVSIGQTTFAFFRQEKHPSAAFMPEKEKDGRHWDVLYKDHGDTRRGQTLVAMYVRIKCGVWMELTKTQYVTYGIDLLREAGVLHVPLKPLPKVDTTISETRQKAQEGFERLLGERSFLKRQAGERADDTAFAQSFAAPWCGIGEQAANEAVIGMLIDGQIVHTRFREGCNFFTRGTKKLVRVLADTVHEQTVDTLKAAIEINRDAWKVAETIASPLRRAGQGEATSLDTDCGVCTVCAAELDTDGFQYFCPSCGWDERASPLCT